MNVKQSHRFGLGFSSSARTVKEGPRRVVTRKEQGSRFLECQYDLLSGAGPEICDLFFAPGNQSPNRLTRAVQTRNEIVL